MPDLFRHLCVRGRTGRYVCGTVGSVLRDTVDEVGAPAASLRHPGPVPGSTVPRKPALSGVRSRGCRNQSGMTAWVLRRSREGRVADESSAKSAVQGRGIASPMTTAGQPSNAPGRPAAFLLSPRKKKAPHRCGALSISPQSQAQSSRRASSTFSPSAISVPSAPDSRYAPAATSPNASVSASAASGAKPAPNSHARSDVSAAPV